jgi:hypothetical protein
MSEFVIASLTECYVCGAALPPVTRGQRFYCSKRCCDRRSESGMPRPAASSIDLFTQRYVVLPDGCWQWTGRRARQGYGGFSVTDRVGSRREVAAHRWSYEHFVGPIPEGLQLDHLCRNRLCVNPAHLEPVTVAENVLRGESPCARNARKTHCKHGHEFTPENTMRNRTGRACRQCQNRRLRERYAALRAAVTGEERPLLTLIDSERNRP